MLRDLRADADGVRIDTEVCIVGAGAAGITLARELAGTHMRVVLVESGGLEPAADTDVLNRGESAGRCFHGLEQGRARAFGGTTKLWDGQCLALERIDLEPRDWVPHSGWPITKTDLTPFYARARSVLRIPEHVCDDWVWRHFDLRRPDFDAAALGCTVAVISHRLDLGALSREELARSTNVQVLLHANATEIHTNDTGSAVQSIGLRTLEGRTGRVTAKAIVLCGGGIENARLLLLSNRADAKGLGNRHDLVGRFLQEHPTADAGALRTNVPTALQRHFSVVRKDALRFVPKILLSEDVQRRERVLGCAADVTYEYDVESGIGAAKDLSSALRERRWPGDLPRKAGHVLMGFDQIATTVYRRYVHGRLTASPPRVARLLMHLEQAPNPLSRVSLSHERDALGLNRARVDWRLTDLDERTAEVTVRTVDAELGRLGLGRLDVAEWTRGGGADWAARFREAYHHIGTTRMADDPQHGVVDANCRVHGVAGLYVAGSSVFATSGYANPTFTIVALALRLADHLKAISRR